jgi:polysaccharide deacetylase family protein (PEP-CTERM system associated)
LYKPFAFFVAFVVSNLFSSKLILLTVDVEDWFQVENFKPWIPCDSWDSFDLRVERNTHRLLDLFDSFGSPLPAPSSPLTSGLPLPQAQRSSSAASLQPNAPFLLRPQAQRSSSEAVLKPNAPFLLRPQAKRSSSAASLQPNATFFFLAWLAERLPGLVREIHERGHEVASHGYGHCLCTDQCTADLKADLETSKKILEDLVGAPVMGYRAPSFSVTDDVLKVVEDCGYLYDSSYNSFGLNSRYGRITLNDDGNGPGPLPVGDRFFEIPVSNLKLAGRTLPWAGGGYFRLVPFPIFRLGVAHILSRHGAYVFYMHPWEVDPEQPKVREASALSRFRHRHNLHKTEERLASLIESFRDCRFVTCSEYLGEKAR